MNMTPQAWPEWYDGRHINEVLFCQQFLDKHPMKCVCGRLFTVDGLIEDEGQIGNLILEEISGVLTTKDRPTVRADDPFLVDKLLREKEGIFLWCLEGLHRLIRNNYQFSISGKARANMETVKRCSNNVIEFLHSEGYIRFTADSEASSKAIYETYTRWCDDNAQKPMSANRVSSELTQNERLYNVEATNNVHVGGKRVQGFNLI